MLALAAAIAVTQPVPAARSGPTSILVTGPITHSSAGATFPERVGVFRRTHAVAYDPTGESIGVTYRSDDVDLDVNVTISPISERTDMGQMPNAADCTRRFQNQAATVSNFHREARRRPTATAVNPGPGGDPRFAHRATWDLPTDVDGLGGPHVAQLDLYCYVRGRWLVTYRTTGVADVDVRAAVEQFVGVGPRPGRTVRAKARASHRRATAIE